MWENEEKEKKLHIGGGGFVCVSRASSLNNSPRYYIDNIPVLCQRWRVFWTIRPALYCSSAHTAVRPT